MTNFIIVAIVLAVIGSAVMYIIKEKKRGVKCIGCPAGVECAHGHGGCNGCGGSGECKGDCGCHTETTK